MSKDIYYKIAGHGIHLSYSNRNIDDMFLLQSFIPFISTPDDAGDILFNMDIDDSLTPLPSSAKEHIKTCDTGNGDAIVYEKNEGGYEIIMKDINGMECCLLNVNSNFTSCRCALNGGKTMRIFGLNNALMITFAFAGSYHETLLIHASTVVSNGKGYAFTAKSGTGKSTHTSLWMRNIPGTELMNDDNPVIRIINGAPFIYGSPWSGKTPCYRNISAPLGALTKIERADSNSVSRMPAVMAYICIIESCSSMKWDVNISRRIGDIATKIIETTGIYTLRCLPDREAAEICHKTITR